MRHLLVTVISVSTAFVSSMAAVAQVEPRLAGEWQLEPGPDQESRTLHVEGDGKYQTVSNGQVLDSGKITLYDGTWKLKANSGYSDTGRFSVVNGQLKLYSGSLAGKWLRTGGGSSSASSQAAQSSQASRSMPHTQMPQTPASVQNMVQSDEQMSASNADEPAAQQPPATGRKLPTWVKSIPSLVKQQLPNSMSSGNSSGTSSGASSGNSPAYTRQLPGYNIPGYKPQRSLPGYDPAAFAGQSKNGNYVSTTPRHSQAGVEYRKVRPNAYVSKIWNPDGVEGVAPAQPKGTVTPQSSGYAGLRPVPKGGYIPVMKDNKARKYFQGF